MPDLRLIRDDAYRIGLASPLVFSDWTAPTTTELNSNSSNDPSGLIWNLTCAVNVDNSQFDLDDPDFDDSLTFCQKSGDQTRMVENATVVFDIALAKERWTNASTTTGTDPVTGMNLFNTSTLAQSLLTWRGVEYFAWLSIGKDADDAFAVGDVISMVRVISDHGIPSMDTGGVVSLNNAMGFRSDILWQYEILT